MSRIKSALIIEAAIIILLLIALINPPNQVSGKLIAKDGLLSSRIYSGMLEPKSHLITNFYPLKRELERFIGNQTVSVYVENLRDGSSFEINGRYEFSPLSLNKVPLAVSIMQKVEAGKLSMDTKIPIPDHVRDERSGILYNDSSQQLPLRILMEKMLSESDNTAFYTLLEYLNQKDLKFLLDYYPIDFELYYNNSLNDSKSFYLSPKGYSHIFRSLYFSALLDTKNSEYLLSLLAKSAFDVKKIANLPADAEVVHKFGVNYSDKLNSFHDCGIMYTQPNSRILYCIMTDGLGDKSVNTVGTIMNGIYNYVSAAREYWDLNKQK